MMMQALSLSADMSSLWLRGTKEMMMQALPLSADMSSLWLRGTKEMMQALPLSADMSSLWLRKHLFSRTHSWLSPTKKTERDRP